jgi:hypothetical protein
VVKSRKVRWVLHVAHIGENRKGFCGKRGGRRPLGRHMLGCKDDTVSDLKEIGCESMD